MNTMWGTPQDVGTIEAPASGTLASALLKYQLIQEAVKRGDTDEQIVAGCGVTDQTIRTLRVDPMFIAACGQS